MGKTLYFEGAGMQDSIRGDVENCRIRTAFSNDKGQKIYLEIMGVEVTKHTKKSWQGYKNVGFVDYCFFITGGRDDCNKSRIDKENQSFEYTKANILRFVNSLGCSFDEVVILPDLAGYRVFKDGSGYNYGDKFNYEPELTARRQEVERHFYETEKAERQKDRTTGAKKFVHSPSGICYPNFSLWVDENDKYILHLLRHYNGYNKHWTISVKTDNWINTVTEAVLGKYAC